MAHQTITETVNLTQDSGIEILVNFTKEWELIENGAGFADTYGYSYTLNSCEIVVKGGNSINITKQLNHRQVQNILDEVAELETI